MVMRRFLALIIPLVLALGFELLFYMQLNIKAISATLIGLFILLFISLALLIKEKIRSKNFWSLAVLPLFFYLLVTNYILTLSYGYLRHIVIILFALILYTFLENLFLFYYHRASYQVNSLENSSLFLNIIIFFLLVLNLNALSVLLNPPLWILSLCLVLILFVILWQLFWIFKIKDKLKILYVLVAIIIILEFFWALSFLPSNFYVLAVILTVIYYFMLGIIRAKMAGELDKKMFLRYTIISGILILIILITSHWI